MTVTIWVVWFLLQIGSDFSDRIWFVTPDIIWSGSPDANSIGIVLFLLVNIPLSIYTVVILLKGCASGENKTLLIVFSVLNTLSGLAAWGFLIALMLKP